MDLFVTDFLENMFLKIILFDFFFRRNKQRKRNTCSVQINQKRTKKTTHKMYTESRIRILDTLSENGRLTK